MPQLPLRESDPVKRLAQIKEQTDSVISSPEPFIAAALMKFFGETSWLDPICFFACFFCFLAC